MKIYKQIGIIDAYVHRHRPESVRVLADFYWRSLLSVSLVFLIISVWYGASKLSSAIGESDSALSQNTGKIQSVPKLDKAQLQNALASFGERESRFNTLKAGVQKIADPSR